MPRCPTLIWVVPIAAMLARIAYAVWFSPYEIVADEAQYWDWSRRLDWAYFEKGPGIAWIIAAATSVLGTSLWAIRTPAAVFGAVAMLAVARLTREGTVTRKAEAALTAVVLLALIPAFQLPFLLATTDAPYLACWALASWAGWRAMRAELERRPSPAAWGAAACATGAGLLVNYAALTLLVSLAGFLWTVRHRIDRGGGRRRFALATIGTLAWLTPIIIWNVQHDVAGLGQLLGYLKLPGGVWPERSIWTFNPLWTAGYIGGTVGIIGPAVGLMWIAVRDQSDSDYARWLIWCAGPLLSVFAIASIRTRIEANWPVPAFLTLAALAAIASVNRPKDVQVVRWWRATVAFGIFAALLIHAPSFASHLPLIGSFVPAHRFTGVEARVQALSPVVREFRARFGPDALLVASSHNEAGRISFYLPGRPAVRSAGQFFGGRPSSYDLFMDTTVTSPEIQGRPALLIGEPLERWRERFDLIGIERGPHAWLTRAEQFRVRQQEVSCADCSGSR